MRQQMKLPLVLARTLSIYCGGHTRRVYQVHTLPVMLPNML